jgi:hypothetical protein
MDAADRKEIAMTQPLPPLAPLCSICHKPVDLETSKTDHQGKAVHESCYSARLAHAKPPASET